MGNCASYDANTGCAEHTVVCTICPKMQSTTLGKQKVLHCDHFIACAPNGYHGQFMHTTCRSCSPPGKGFDCVFILSPEDVYDSVRTTPHPPIMQNLNYDIRRGCHKCGRAYIYIRRAYGYNSFGSLQDLKDKYSNICTGKYCNVVLDPNQINLGKLCDKCDNDAVNHADNHLDQNIAERRRYLWDDIQKEKLTSSIHDSLLDVRYAT
jgi:hypothetical protein